MKNLYQNCLYACRYCNGARSTRPVEDSRGRRLLDPSRKTWAKHFRSDGDEIIPVEGDDDAHYTHEVYHMNDLRKVEYRRFRRQLYADCLQVLSEAPALIESMIEEAERSMDADPERSRRITSQLRLIHRVLKVAGEDLTRFAAIPADAPSNCRCESTEHHSLPRGLEEQMIDLPIRS